MSNSLYDPTLPKKLRNTQEWFGSIISRPLVPEDQLNPISPSGRPIEQEARDYIAPSPTLQPDERIQIYSQQYWWRLLKCLHDNLPLTTRLFGYTEFNKTIGTPYLTKYPPDSWSLSQLGMRAPQWIQDEYHEPDKELVLDAASLDCDYIRCFIAPRIPALKTPTELTPEYLEGLLEQKLFLQPHVKQYTLKRQLFKYRDAFLKEKNGDYWLANDFPPLESAGPYHVVLFRSHYLEPTWRELSPGASQFLTQFQHGSSISEALDWLDGKEDELVQEVATNLRTWLQDWVAHGWFTTHPLEAQ